MLVKGELLPFLDMQAMIPKKIHSCWFGGGEKNQLIQRCMESWVKHLPEYELFLWDESNVNLESPFLSEMVKKKNWAFVSDYVRLEVLYAHGGIYLDTDVEIVKSLNSLLDEECFLGFEAEGRINSAVIGACSGHPFLKQSMLLINERFEKGHPYMIAPEVATAVFHRPEISNTVRVFGQEYFYPYNPYDEQRKTSILMYMDVTDNTYAIHHWNKAWSLGFFEKMLRKVSGLIK